MEHRWGIRRTLDIGVQLYVPLNLPRSGRLLNASSSGAYLATTATLPVMTLVHVALACASLQRDGRHRIPAYVARADARGVGIEWQELAPPAVLALIDDLEVLPRRGRRTQRPTNPAL